MLLLVVSYAFAFVRLVVDFVFSCVGVCWLMWCATYIHAAVCCCWTMVVCLVLVYAILVTELPTGITIVVVAVVGWC